MTKDKGVLHPSEASKHFSIDRVPFVGDLAQYIEHVWIIRWDLPDGQTYETEVLPYPAVNIIFLNGTASIAGVGTKKFTQQLKGQGIIIGILFKPAWAYAFLRRPLGELTDVYTPLEMAWPTYDTGLAAQLLACNDNDEIMQRLQVLLQAQSPVFSQTVDAVSKLVERIASDTTFKKVMDVAKASNLSERRLEQLFYEYVGMSPKLVISRFRIQEVANRLSKNPSTSLTGLAYEFGYSDQSHFTRDFRRIIGYTPTEYSRRLQSTA